jgi:1-acyl-sn-glycerol-3-phosphate acyltransferase
VPDLPKIVCILGKHTSNWDGVWCVALMFAMEDRPVGWVMKDVAFRFPFRTVLRWLGAIPVNRHAPEGFVKQASERFMEGKSSMLCIAPEGTRGKVGQWKTGFYRIAQECDVPIMLGFLDYGRRVGGVGPVIWPTGDYDADMRKIAEFYNAITPRNPDSVSEIR